MKFKDLKQGDTVYTHAGIRIGWSAQLRFWLPKQVAKVTPKRFAVGRRIYRKEDGLEIGGTARACLLGDSISSNEVVTDQTQEHTLFIAKLNTLRGINDLVEDLKITYDNPRLNEILSKLKEIEALC